MDNGSRVSEVCDQRKNLGGAKRSQVHIVMRRLIALPSHSEIETFSSEDELY